MFDRLYRFLSYLVMGVFMVVVILLVVNAFTPINAVILSVGIGLLFLALFEIVTLIKSKLTLKKLDFILLFQAIISLITAITVIVAWTPDLDVNDSIIKITLLIGLGIFPLIRLIKNAINFFFVEKGLKSVLNLVSNLLSITLVWVMMFVNSSPVVFSLLLAGLFVCLNLYVLPIPLAVYQKQSNQ